MRSNVRVASPVWTLPGPHSAEAPARGPGARDPPPPPHSVSFSQQQVLRCRDGGPPSQGPPKACMAPCGPTGAPTCCYRGVGARGDPSRLPAPVGTRVFLEPSLLDKLWGGGLVGMGGLFIEELCPPQLSRRQMHLITAAYTKHPAWPFPLEQDRVCVCVCVCVCVKT